jgi:uncharacterized membrane protein
MGSLPRADGQTRKRKLKSIRPDLFEKLLAAGTMIMLLVVAVAIARGRSEWGDLKPAVWAHLITIIVALILTPLLLLQKRGTHLHRQLGWAWAIAMFSTAVISLFVHESGPGFSPIHLLSVLTIIGVPLTIYAAHRHAVAAHRFGIRFAVTGALLIAGFFTFPFGRMMGRWLLG